MNVYVTAIGVVLKVAAIVAAIVLATSIAEFLWVPQIFEGPEWILWYWTCLPVPAITMFTIYAIGGAVYAALYSLDRVWRNQPSQ
jgi:uncharacterized protein (DUF983 family)